MTETTIDNLEQRFAKQGGRVSGLTARLKRDLAQVRRTRIELRESRAALRALVREAQNR